MASSTQEYAFSLPLHETSNRGLEGSTRLSFPQNEIPLVAEGQGCHLSAGRATPSVGVARRAER